MSNAKKLKIHSNFSMIYISRDLTYNQRQELRKRRSSFHPSGDNAYNPISLPGALSVCANSAPVSTGNILHAPKSDTNISENL